jgi:Na+/melibiose symporter-like transporter
MFAGVINQAKAAASGLVLKYVARASVAIPFVIGLGFALAAVATMLVQNFGSVTAYWLMAGGLAAIGVIAAIGVSVKEHEEEVAEQKAEEADAGPVLSDATAQALTQAPLALLGGLFAAPGGPTTALKLAGLLARNFPLVLLLVFLSTLLWPTAASEASPDADIPAADKPNGADPVQTLH